jgi:predicted SAM-dependent methyltransferase
MANRMLVRFIERTTSCSFRAELQALAREWRTMRAHRSGVRKASSVKPPYSLHIGCGPNKKPGWVNIDLNKSADIRLDLREALPFPDNSVKMVYSEHFFEHLTREDGIRFLGECLRVLLPGGRLSVGVPDAQICMRDYVRDDRDKWWKLRDRSYPEWCSTPMHMVNYFFRQDGEHKYVYDAETLIELVKDCGFSNVNKRPWDPALDLEVRRDGTLYVDGEKKMS